MVLYDIPGDVERWFAVLVSYGLSMQWRMSSSSQDVGYRRECWVLGVASSEGVYSEKE